MKVLRRYMCYCAINNDVAEEIINVNIEVGKNFRYLALHTKRYFMMKAYLKIGLLLFFIIAVIFYLKPSEYQKPNFIKGFTDINQSTPNLKDFHLEQAHLLSAIDEIRQREQTDGLAQDMEWFEKGPTNIGGRTRVLLIDQIDTTGNTVWAAGVSGGLWKTTNFRSNSTIWETIDFDFPNLGICALVQDPGNPNIFYIGTGEFWTGSGVPGAGIWKSVDGGNTWEHLVATANELFSYTNRLLIDQNGYLYAATSTSGIMKSKDEGTSWAAVLDNTSGTLSNIAADIEIAANGDLYASFGGYGTRGYIYKSNAGQAAGEIGNWTRLDIPYLHRKEIACAPSDVNRVYVLAAENDVMTNLFVSHDGGNSWLEKDVFDDQRDEQANYNMALSVSNDDPDFVMAGGISMFKSYNAGDDWARLPASIHVDHHYIIFTKPNSAFDKEAILATDGGMWRVWENPSNAPFSSTQSKNNFYRTTQFYGLAVHPDIGSQELIGGTQDNGNLFFNEPGQEEVFLSNGDGGFPYIDQDQPQLRIINAKRNNFQVSTNGGNHFSDYRTILLDDEAAFINATDYDDTNNILYASSFQSSFLRIKDVFEENPIVEYVGFKDISDVVITSVDVSPNNPQIVYFGREKLYRVNLASEATSVETDVIMDVNTGGGVFRMRNAAIEKGNEEHILVSVFSGDESKDYLWETKNSTAASPTWESFQGDLPKIPVYWVIFMPQNPDQALIGTEFGIWITEDIDGANTHWEQCKNGIPNVRVTQLIHRESDDRIVASSYGRGLFYTQFFEENYAFFTQKSLQVNEADIFKETECRSSIDIDIPLEISKLLAEPVTLSVAIDNSASTAKTGQDYEILGNTSFTFTEGMPLRQNLKLRFYDDAEVEDTETLRLLVTSNNNDITVSQAAFDIEFIDNEVQLSLGNTQAEALNEVWTRRNSFFVPPWKHSPSVPDLSLSQTSYNIWRVSEVCNTINLFTASLWYYDGPTFRSTCGYLSELPSTSIMYREVDAQGLRNLVVEFDWIAGGKRGEDYGSIVYSLTEDPLQWVELPSQYVEQDQVQHANINLPADLNEQVFQIGWKWQNAGNGTGQEALAMSVDNIVIKGTLAPTQAETELALESRFIGENEDVLFFSDRKKIMAEIASQNEPIGCTTIGLNRFAGVAVEFDTIGYTGFYLPYSYDISFETESENTLDIGLFFDPSSITQFLGEVGVSQDSLAIYFMKDGDFSQVTPIHGLELSSVAEAQKIDFDHTIQNGTYILGWLQPRCVNAISTVNQTICFGENYQGYNSTGTYEDTFVGNNGCDSIRLLNLTVLDQIVSNISVGICPNGNYEGYTEPGNYQDIFIAANGCDSTRNLSLFAQEIIYTNISTRICQGESYEGYTVTGSYTDTLQTSTGCDSIRRLNLSVYPILTRSLQVAICEGDSYEGYTEDGTYVDTLQSRFGCDSIRTLFLSVDTELNTTVDATICGGESYDGYTMSGTYTDMFVTGGGCDSTRTLNLTVLPQKIQTIDTTICQGDNYEGYFAPGTYRDVFPTSNGCDSTRILNLGVEILQRTGERVRICEGESYNGYTETGTYRDTLQTALGCDSIHTTILIIIQPSAFTVRETICEGEAFEGYTETGVYRDTLVSSFGCDSIRILRLTVNPSQRIPQHITICEGEQYEGYSETGVYEDTFIGVNGCDSIRILNLNVLTPVESMISTKICEGESYEGYINSGTYTDMFETVEGCDSTRILNLEVLPKIEETISIDICQGEVYEGYSTSGVYEDTFIASTGCDSVRTLNLTVLESIETTISKSICQGEEFEGYTESGMYEDVFTGVNGCDSTRLINLTVLPDTAQQCVSTYISRQFSSEEIFLYPNPVEDYVKIDWSIRQTRLRYRLFNGKGQIVSRGIIEKGGELSMRGLAEGIYRLQLWDGQQFGIKSIMKQ